MRTDYSLLPANLTKITNLPDLAFGDAHPDVLEVQRLLSRYGYLATPNVQIGKFDGPTQSATTRFQQFFAIPETNGIGPLTRALMARPRCAMPDVDPLGATNTGPWSRKNLTFSFGVLTTQVSAEQATNAIRAALMTWQGAGVGLTFAEVDSTLESDIKFEWRPADDPDHNMRGLMVAHSDLPPGYSLFTAALPLPVHFNNEEHAWGIGLLPNALDIESVALHEIGHALGLLHSIAGSVMYPIKVANSTERQLMPDDHAHLASLYP
jgi:hypothetical protein